MSEVPFYAATSFIRDSKFGMRDAGVRMRDGCGCKVRWCRVCSTRQSIPASPSTERRPRPHLKNHLIELILGSENYYTDAITSVIIMFLHEITTRMLLLL